VAAIQQVIVDTGALAELEAHISALTDQAVTSLRRMDLYPEAVTELTLLAQYVSWREI
jgi:geranylgeranyl diphosphate synthase type I